MSELDKLEEILDKLMEHQHDTRLCKVTANLFYAQAVVVWMTLNDIRR